MYWTTLLTQFLTYQQAQAKNTTSSCLHPKFSAMAFDLIGIDCHSDETIRM